MKITGHEHLSSEAVASDRALSDRDRIATILGRLGHWLPEQGPIGVFIHQNTLQALEEMTFERAVEFAATVRGAEPYLSHSAFLEEKKRGRISEPSIERALDRNLDFTAGGSSPIAKGLGTRREVWRSLLEILDLKAPDATILFLAEERGFRDGTPDERWEKLITRWRDYLSRFPQSKPVPYESHEISEEDETLISIAAGYLDQGVSYHSFPLREKGFLASFRVLQTAGDIGLPSFLRWNKVGKPIPDGDALEVLVILLNEITSDVTKWEPILFRQALSLPGWAGIFHLLERRSDLLPRKRAVTSLADFMAVKLFLNLRHEKSRPEQVRRPSQGLATVYTAAQLLALRNVEEATLVTWSDAEWDAFFGEIHIFDDVPRRRVFHHAYEDHFNHIQVGSLLANIAQNREMPATAPRFQALFCLDEREESFRRHLEEVAPEFETYGVAGFFGVEMWYRGMGDTDAVTLCPVVLTPKHQIEEIVSEPHAVSGQKKMQRFTTTQRLATWIYDESRHLLAGYFFSVVAAFVPALLMFTKIFFPGKAFRLKQWISRRWYPEVVTELAIERAEEIQTEQGRWLGFTTEEMTARVENTLRQVGLTKNFAPVVFVIGHGSSSLNNPHESAYSCGACGGRKGGPNGRAYAAMANHSGVRSLLRARGIDIPTTTLFVGGYHDTCATSVTLSPSAGLDEKRRSEIGVAKHLLEQACERDAHERCRRFDDGRHLDPRRALNHVRARGQDLREPRPEYGHATNAVTIIGRRKLSKHLFLDRRSFLASYDPHQDPEGNVLAGIMGAAVPVCAGISLEYYFSHVDSEKYGCGTKLPHNVTSGIGVMNGRLSDLRTGLTRQMVEIHEPLRNLFIIDAKQAVIEKILNTNAVVGRLVKNGWVQMVAIDPDTGVCTRVRNGQFEPFPIAPAELAEFADSKAYYQGKGEHLVPVRIKAGKGGRP